MFKITCIIPSSCSQKTLPFLSKCVRALRRADKKDFKLFIILVSNNSGRTCLDLKTDRVYSVPHHFGFAKMNNYAIDASIKTQPSDYFLLINDDAQITPNFFARLSLVIRQSDPEIICPLVYRINSLNTRHKFTNIDSFGIEYFRSGFAKNAEYAHIHTSLSPGVCLTVTTSLLKKMKNKYGFYLNPILHSYYEDIEFSIRALMLGAKIKKDKNIIAYHFGSLSYGKQSPLVIYYSLRNLLWVIILTWPKTFIFKNLLAIIIVQGLFFIDFPLIYVRVFFTTLKKFKILLPIRRKIISQYSRKCNFSQVFSGNIFRTRKHGISI